MCIYSAIKHCFESSLNPFHFVFVPTQTLLLCTEACALNSGEFFLTIKHRNIFLLPFLRSIKAVTKTGHAEIQIQDELHKREQALSPNRRDRCKKKKSTKRSPHQLAAYNTSDRKAAVTVGVIMGVFLGETDD